MLMDCNLPIGVFDSGVGGLTVLKNIRNILPSEDIIYFGDTKRTPYGFRSANQIKEFTREILTFMQSKKIKLAVAACNTITVNLDDLHREFDFEIVGMNNGVHTAVNLTKNNKIGVIGTVATINSNKHLEEITAINPDVQVFPRACPQFASLVEAEQFNSKIVKEYAAEYLIPLKETGVDTVILACTHFSFIIPVISKVLAGVQLIDPTEETALQVKLKLEEANLLKNTGEGYNILYFSADLERTKRIFSYIYDINKCEFECVDLPEIIHPKTSRKLTPGKFELKTLAQNAMTNKRF